MDTDTPTTETETQPKSASLLAAEAFGKEFYGEVIIEEEIVEDSAQEALEVAEEVDAETVKTEEAEAETAQEEQETPISSFSELAEHLETDMDFLNGLEADVKINGESGKVKIADILSSYQTQEAANQRLEEAKSKAKEITNDLAKKQEQVQQQFAVAAELIQDEQTKLDAEESAIDWEGLKRLDPADYAAKKLDFQDRKASIQAKVSKAADKYQEAVSANQLKLEGEQALYLAQENAALLSKIPEWSDAEVRKAGDIELSEFLAKNGMESDEIKGITDHRLILLARKAMLYDQGQEKTEPLKKRLRSIPKVLKPGGSKPVGNKNQTEIARLKKLLSSGQGDLETAFKIKQLQRA